MSSQTDVFKKKNVYSVIKGVNFISYIMVMEFRSDTRIDLSHLITFVTEKDVINLML